MAAVIGPHFLLEHIQQSQSGTRQFVITFESAEATHGSGRGSRRVSGGENVAGPRRLRRTHRGSEVAVCTSAAAFKAFGYLRGNSEKKGEREPERKREIRVRKGGGRKMKIQTRGKKLESEAFFARFEYACAYMQVHVPVHVCMS